MVDNSKHIMIRKASGEMEAFDPIKLLRSLNSAGADEQIAHQILLDIEPSLFNGISTRKIYKKALSLLRQKLKSSAIRYRIKDALMELGDSGHPFEVFTGEIYKHLGYAVKTAIVVEGKSITHEMDVIATSDNTQQLIECKYSKLQGKYISIQVPLYVYSRVNDIIAYRSKLEKYNGFSFTAGVATNTRFSPDCIKYASDYGIHLLSWNYPEGKSLREIIHKEHILPITILSTLNQHEKEYLISHDIVTCEQLLQNNSILTEMGLSRRKMQTVRIELDTTMEQKVN
ncbi:MAG: hypothetical protein BKP49_09630 [Treponema sp. CETP13]|nr:MAG: hypothetical protein BKP49_09630 [Treponema sp. CETP13]